MDKTSRHHLNHVTFIKLILIKTLTTKQNDHVSLVVHSPCWHVL